MCKPGKARSTSKLGPQGHPGSNPGRGVPLHLS